MHYDKNGFFYVLDRTNGKFIYGEPIVPGINWTLGLDPETGRPKVNPDMLAQSGGPEVALVVPRAWKELLTGSRWPITQTWVTSTSCPTTGPWVLSFGQKISSHPPPKANGTWGRLSTILEGRKYR